MISLLSKIEQLKKQYQGTPVIATEPVFNYLAEAPWSYDLRSRISTEYHE